MKKLVDAGVSTEEIMAEIDSHEFVMSYWIMVYQSPKDQFEKREAVRELRKMMLVS